MQRQSGPLDELLAALVHQPSVAAAGGGTFSSSDGEQQMLAAQASVQARLQIWWWVTDISSLWMTEGQEQEANSGWMVQHLTPTLWSTFKTSEIRSAHLLGQHSLLMGTEMKSKKKTKSELIKLMT